MPIELKVDEEQFALDRDIWIAIKSRAEPFVDTPNSVLRKVLGLDTRSATIRNSSSDHGGGVGRAARKPGSTGRAQRSRVPKGTLLPEGEYELPILKVLEANGGRAPTREVVAAVGEILAGNLTELDKEPMANGSGCRWENRTQFARLSLVRKGLLNEDSPRGVWEISSDGRERLKREATKA